MFLLKKRTFWMVNVGGPWSWFHSWWGPTDGEMGFRPNEHFLFYFKTVFFGTIRVCPSKLVGGWFYQIPGLVATYQTMSMTWYLTHCHVVLQENRIEVTVFMKVSGFKNRNFKHKLLVSVVGMWSQCLGAYCRWRLSWVKYGKVAPNDLISKAVLWRLGFTVGISQILSSEK